jgi:RNA polymerase sigma factor (sigma-70 family)
LGNDPNLPLLRGIADGDEAALEALYQRCGPQLLASLERLLNDRTAAEDTLQIVMMTVWQTAASFRGESRVMTWLHSIARRQALSLIRRTRETLPIPDEDVLTADEPEAASTSGALQAALRHLPDIERRAIDLIYVEGHTLAHAADQLGVPVNTVKSRLARARLSLRRWLKHEEIDHA